MQVVLKPSVLDEIHKRLSEADRRNRKVDHIIVSPEEYAELRGNIACPPMFSQNPCVEMKTITLGRGLERMRFASRETLYDYPLYVVPAEYHAINFFN
jgi:hypothetical protein